MGPCTEIRTLSRKLQQSCIVCWLLHATEYKAGQINDS